MAKPAKCLLDTNMVLRYLLNDVSEQFTVAKQIFEELRTSERSALLLESVLAECVYVLTLHYKVPKAELAEMLDNVLRYPGIANSDKPSLREALKLYAANNIDFVDCLLVAKARIGELELITFDQDLKKLNHI
jgi:predicted nucleic-acid-binding protein